MECVAESLEGLTKTEFYIRAIQKPLPTVSSAQELLLDYQFCKLFKSLEGLSFILFIRCSILIENINCNV
jgi:hypothetical protein